MDDNKKRAIENTLVSCFDNHTKIRNISGSEEYACKTKEEIDQKKTKGFYLIKSDNFFSILRLEEILYFVYGSQVFDIKQSGLKFICQNIDGNRRKFNVYIDENRIVSIDYDRITDFEDNWSTEDDLDMFAWISNIYSKGRLDNILQY